MPLFSTLTSGRSSQSLAGKAMQAGLFKEEIVPVIFPATKKIPQVVFDVDEHVRLEPPEHPKRPLRR